MPRRQFLFIGKKEPKTMSAESASLKIGCTSLKVRNLPYVRVALKTPTLQRLQTDWLFTLRSTDFLNAHQPRRQSRYAHFVSRAKGSLSAICLKRSRNSVFAEISDHLRPITASINIETSPTDCQPASLLACLTITFSPPYFPILKKITMFATLKRIQWND